MRILAQEEYGLRCLLRVAQLSEGSPVPVSAVAASEGLSCEYTRLLLQKLRKAGLLTGARGPGGGYRLSRPAEEIRLLSVIEQLDGPLLWAEGFCDRHTGLAECCTRSTDCSIRALWRAVSDGVASVLSGMTLADLLHKESRTADLIPLSNVLARGA